MDMGSSSSAVTGASASTDSMNGLKFGKKIYFEDVGSAGSAKTAALPGSSSSPAPRRGRGVVQGGQPPRCQVEGCKMDLTGAKPYYCRHKVCGMHSKSPKVIVNGMEQRFCQQCSRSAGFCSLVSFFNHLVLSFFLLLFRTRFQSNVGVWLVVAG